MDLNTCAHLLEEMENILILTHARPDGDTLGSAAALCHCLRTMGKNACLYNNPEITEKFLPFVQDYLAPKGFEAKAVVAVDLADQGLFPRGYSGVVDLCIDHHPSNSGYACETLLKATKASCGEIIYEVILALRGNLEKEEADLLYMAVSTDTGCFCYANTRGDTLKTAALLVEAGADNWKINKLMFRTFSRSRLVLEGLIYASLRSYRENRINIAVITKEMMQQAGATENDCDDIASLPGRVEGNQISATVRELDNGESKISLRSIETYNSSEICAQFGGGGHAMAAGCSMACGPTEAAERILQAILEVMG
jgi:phosphoesterase RecJ-like protein